MSLQKIPWVYLLALITMLVFLPGIKKKIQNSEEFYGIAENQIRNYNRSDDVIIQSILVKLGQSVHSGDTLMIFQPKNLYFKKEDLASESRQIEIAKKIDLFQLKQDIFKWQEQKKLITSTYRVKKDKLLAQKLLADSLARLVTNQPVSDRKYEMDLNLLNEQMAVELKEIDQKIAALQSTITSAPDPTREKQYNIRNELNRINVQEKELILIADMEGTIGQIDLKPGDPVKAYESLIRIYSNHPNMVTTYINENYLGSVTPTDSVRIESISTIGYKLDGKILNLGSRITALPDRLKKIPEIRTWGREVQIEIPMNNLLIQGEKVKVVFPSLNR